MTGVSPFRDFPWANKNRQSSSGTEACEVHTIGLKNKHNEIILAYKLAKLEAANKNMQTEINAIKEIHGWPVDRTFPIDVDEGIYINNTFCPESHLGYSDRGIIPRPLLSVQIINQGNNNIRTQTSHQKDGWIKEQGQSVYHSLSQSTVPLSENIPLDLSSNGMILGTHPDNGMILGTHPDNGMILGTHPDEPLDLSCSLPDSIAKRNENPHCDVAPLDLSMTEQNIPESNAYRLQSCSSSEPQLPHLERSHQLSVREPHPLFLEPHHQTSTGPQYRLSSKPLHMYAAPQRHMPQRSPQIPDRPIYQPFSSPPHQPPTGLPYQPPLRHAHQPSLGPAHQLSFGPGHQLPLRPAHQMPLGPSHQLSWKQPHQLPLGLAHQQPLGFPPQPSLGPAHPLPFGTQHQLSFESSDQLYSQNSNQQRSGTQKPPLLPLVAHLHQLLSDYEHLLPLGSPHHQYLNGQPTNITPNVVTTNEASCHQDQCLENTVEDNSADVYQYNRWLQQVLNTGENIEASHETAANLSNTAEYPEGSGMVLDSSYQQMNTMPRESTSTPLLSDNPHHNLDRDPQTINRTTGESPGMSETIDELDSVTEDCVQAETDTLDESISTLDDREHTTDTHSTIQ